MEAPAGLERSVTKTAAMPFVRIFGRQRRSCQLEQGHWRHGTTAANRNMFIRRVSHSAMLHGCLCLSTNTSLTRSHTCAPQRLQPLLIVCSCFAEKTEWLTVSSLALSRPIPTPVWAACLPAVRSSLMPPPHGRSSRFHLGTSLRSRMSGLEPHPRSSSEPRLWSVFTCFPHTKTWSVARAFGKTCFTKSTEFKVCSTQPPPFWNEFWSSRQSRESSPAFAFLYFKKADYSTK